MHINLETCCSWVLHVITFFYIFTFLNKFTNIEKTLSKLDRQIQRLKNKEYFSDQDDDEIKNKKVPTIKKKNLADKIVKTSNNDESPVLENKNNKDEKDDDEEDSDDNEDEQDEQDEQDMEDEDISNSDRKVIEQFEDKPPIEGFNSINYNDLVDKKFNISSTNVYDTDFSNIYNNYIKNNLVDISSTNKKRGEHEKETAYLKTNCRGWRK